MRVLVTGNTGMIGSRVSADLRSLSHSVVEFDVSTGKNILDSSALDFSAQGCGVIIHAAALMGHPNQTDEEILQVNLLGTWNVLTAAKRNSIPRVVFLSSVDSLGVFKGERAPDYLPLDNDHECYPHTPYAISKRLAEDMCFHFAATGPTSIVCLRPPGVWTEETYSYIQKERNKRTEFEWSPFWEYGAFLDVRDLSRACICAMTCHVDKYACLLVASSDITTSGRTSRQIAEFVMPLVEWRGGSEYEERPFQSLIDIAPAMRTLDWVPEYTWQKYVQTAVRIPAQHEHRFRNIMNIDSGLT